MTAMPRVSYTQLFSQLWRLKFSREVSEDLGSGEGHVGGHKWYPLAVPLHGGRDGDVLLTLPENINLIQMGFGNKTYSPPQSPTSYHYLGVST